MGAHMISATGLTHVYGAGKSGAHTALDDFNLQVDEGAFFGLLGPNGAGKSTAIACMAGLRTPKAGRVEVGGVDVAKDPKAAQALIGLVPQSLALFPDLSVADNLKTFAGVFGLQGNTLTQRVDWGLELAQLQAKRGARVDTLSGGMARRLNLACGLMHNPRLIICDEPTAGVDPQSRNHIFEMLRQLHAEGRTIVYTTHYMEEVEALCERVAIMDRGKVIANDVLGALLEPPSEAAAAGEQSFQLKLQGPQQLAAVQAALAQAAVGDGPLAGAELSAPPRSLEQLFLELTGRSLRDGDSDDTTDAPTSQSEATDV